MQTCLDDCVVYVCVSLALLCTADSAEFTSTTEETLRPSSSFFEWCQMAGARECREEPRTLKPQVESAQDASLAVILSAMPYNRSEPETDQKRIYSLGNAGVLNDGYDPMLSMLSSLSCGSVAKDGQAVW